MLLLVLVIHTSATIGTACTSGTADTAVIDGAAGTSTWCCWY